MIHTTKKKKRKTWENGLHLMRDDDIFADDPQMNRADGNEIHLKI